jgi:AAA+ superfamily predicted ATPase
MTQAQGADIVEAGSISAGSGADRLGETPELPIFTALRHLDELLGRAVVDRHADLGADPFRGLHIASHDVERWLRHSPGEPPRSSHSSYDAVAAMVAAAMQDTAFRWLAETYALSLCQAAIVMIAAAPELDLRYERLYAYLQDDVTRQRPSVDLVLDLVCPGLAARAAGRHEFGPDAALIKQRIVTLGGDAAAPRLGRPIALDDQILALLMREHHLDLRLGGFCSARWPAATLATAPIPPEWRTTLAALARETRTAGRPLRLYLQGPPGSGKDRLAEAIAASIDARLITADLALAGHGAADPAERLRLLFREAWLKSAVLHLQGIDRLRQADPAAHDALLRILALDRGIVVLSGAAPWTAAALEPVGVVPLVLDLLEPGVQRTIWDAALRRTRLALEDEELAVLAERFRLTPAQANEAALAAVNRRRWRAAADGAAPVPAGLDDLFQAARAQCGHELAILARRIAPRRRWDDLVLPDDSVAQLREICTRVAVRRRVLHDWGFGQRLSLGKGVTALFAGPSGTGKTLAAEIVAHELGHFLYRIDLSSVVSKYIGETEKNLDRVFNAAHDANAVLLFDEADALFGKRSEVRDSHDRYANLEISYLLQKMEEFEGLAILATNLRQNIDDAFTRRIALTVHFPFPGEAERRRIWDTIWPKALPLAPDVDATRLARELKMSGGSIKNCALAAAYYAAADGGAVTHAHVLRAARREFQKLGKVPAALDAQTAGTA